MHFQEPIRRLLRQVWWSRSLRYGPDDRMHAICSESTPNEPGISASENAATVVYDDSPPDDTLYTFGIEHSRGVVGVSRPDLWVGMSIFPSEAAQCHSTSIWSGRTNPSPSASGRPPASSLLTSSRCSTASLWGSDGSYIPWLLMGGLLLLASNVMLYNISIFTDVGYIFGPEVLGGIGAGLIVNAPFSVSQLLVAPMEMPSAIGFTMCRWVERLPLP